MSGTAPLLLLSMPQMADPNFARTVVLLCDYTAEDGAFGLVVNRQMSEPACEIVKTEPPVRVDPDLKLWIGGPVDPQSTWVLMAESQGPDEEQREICSGTAAVGLARADAAVAAGAANDAHAGHRRLRGLGPGTARERDRRIVLADDRRRSGLIFGVPAEQMWEAAIRRLGADPANLQTSSGVH